MIVDKMKFRAGAGMLAVFAVLLAVMFSPVFGGKNGPQYLDELYNSLSKGSAYFIPDLEEDSSHFIGTSVGVTLKMESEEQADQTALLYREAGAEVLTSGAQLEVSGDLGGVLLRSLDDADAMYHNDEEAVKDRYGTEDGLRVLFNWWTSFEGMEKALQDQGLNDESEAVSSVRERAIEPAFNYFGIEPESIGSRIGIVIASLVFYVAYTVWYGFALMYLVEGLGLKIRQMFPFKFVARVKLT